MMTTGSAGSYLPSICFNDPWGRGSLRTTMPRYLPPPRWTQPINKGSAVTP